MSEEPLDPTNRLERWRLLLGDEKAEGTGVSLSGQAAAVDQVLDDLYGAGSSQKGGLGGSTPKVSRWLGDIRKYFPSDVVKLMQQDAFDRLGLHQMLLEPEMLNAVEADVNLVATLLSLKNVIPSRTKDTARKVVQKVVDELMKKINLPMQQAVTGALTRSKVNRRPKLKEIDWERTIKANLKHYQPTHKTIIPERLVGFGRKGASLKDVILCIDQSGSMASSLVYASIFGAVLATMRSLDTRMVVFDTAVADLSEHLSDPVDLLFGAQLGGGTDIAQALVYCRQQITRPQDTILVLLTDLFEGGNREEMIRQAAALKESGVQVITLLALTDEGKPFYDQRNAETFAALKIPVFGCTPEQFPEMMAAALQDRDLSLWDSRE